VWGVGKGANSLWRKSKLPKNIPQGLKPIVSYQAFAARLKSCPFKTRLSPQAAKGWKLLQVAGDSRETQKPGFFRLRPQGAIQRFGINRDA
jgi:hypothetical protein